MKIATTLTPGCASQQGGSRSGLPGLCLTQVIDMSPSLVIFGKLSSSTQRLQVGPADGRLKYVRGIAFSVQSTRRSSQLPDILQLHTSNKGAAT